MNDIEQGAAGSGLTPMHLLLDEWGTMGKTRFPNVKGGLISYFFFQFGSTQHDGVRAI